MADTARPSFDLTRHDVGPVAVLVVRGALDIARSPRLAVAINELLRTKPAGVVIDLCDAAVEATTAALRAPRINTG